jgi:tRNA-dihydrouridine synthase C
MGGYDRCVTEFIRVSDQVLPERVFLRMSPELEQGGKTSAGTPVFLQLLGSNAKSLALNARQAQTLEPPGIDLNFGCPSNTVNKHAAGSTLLLEPNRIYDIVAAVRDAVDPKVPVTVKIRLGFSNQDLFDEIVDKIVNAGANELCIHARTKADLYKAPAYWSAVKKVSERVNIPIIINGEIWSEADATSALLQSGCVDLMLGRGALTFPDLAASIKAERNSTHYERLSWENTLEILFEYLLTTQNQHPLFVSNRCKQWLVFLQRHYSGAKVLFNLVKRLKTTDDIYAAIRAYQKNVNNNEAFF